MSGHEIYPKGPSWPMCGVSFKMKYFKREAVDTFQEIENLEAAFQQTDKETINPGTEFYYRRSQRRKEEMV